MQCLLIVKESDAGKSAVWSDGAMLAGLVHVHEAMQRAGVLLRVEGLHDCGEGVRVQYAGDTQSITHHPFEDHACITGFWLIQVNSFEEAVAWARRVPLVDGEIEVRQAAYQILQTDYESAFPSEGTRESAVLVGR
jgi:hypothetical protein